MTKQHVIIQNETVEETVVNIRHHARSIIDELNKLVDTDNYIEAFRQLGIKDPETAERLQLTLIGTYDRSHGQLVYTAPPPKT